jgi:ABC-type transport system substrate-binding protein
MRRSITSKVVWFGLALCIIASMLAFACGEPEPEAPTPVTPTPTPEKPAAEEPALPKPTAPGEAPTERPTAPTAAAEPFRTLPYGGVYDTLKPQNNGGVLKVISFGLIGFDNLAAPTIGIPFWNPTAISAVVERLVIWDEQGLIEPYLAKSWEWSEDRMSLTLKLQEGVKFHDGTDFNAEAMATNINDVIASPTIWLKVFTDAVALDEYTLKLNLVKPNNLALYDLATTGAIVISPTATKLHGAEYMLTHAVGTGAYKFVSMERDVNLIMEKNPDWWQGEPFMDGIEFWHQADPTTAKMAFMAGEGDMFAAVQPVDAQELADAGYTIKTCISGISVLDGDGMNEDSMFNDIRVRKAVYHALDRQAIADAVGYGYYTVTDQYSDPVLWTWNPDVVGYEYDPAKAKELLTEAGYPDGFQTVLTYGATSPVQEQSALIIQQQLSEVGIDITLDPAESGRLRTMGNTGWENQFRFGSSFVVVGFSPFTNYDCHHMSHNIYDHSRYSNEYLDNLYRQAMAEPDQDKMIELYQQLMKEMTDTYCVSTPLYMANGICAQNDYIHGGGFYDPWLSDTRPWTWWMDPH